MNINSIVIAEEEARHRDKFNQIAQKYQMEKEDKNEILTLIDSSYKEWNRSQLDMIRLSKFLKEFLGADYINALCLYNRIRKTK